jgi:hypothetical protein
MNVLSSRKEMPSSSVLLATPLSLYAFESRTINGSHNNIDNPDWGKTGTALLRLVEPDYEDGIQEPAGSHRPSAREVSNVVSQQVDSKLNNKKASDYIWQWGQFIDHDIDLTEGASPVEAFNIAVPAGDNYFDPNSTGTEEIPLNRSVYETVTPPSVANPRQQLNQITAYLDGSMVYGSDPGRAAELRRNDGSGKLKTSKDGLLPYNVNGFPNAGGPSPDLFLAGDVRANEQIGLTAMHTLFVREHNRIAKNIKKRHPAMSGDEIYQRARRRVGVMIQVITYKEFLPVLLGPGALKPYGGYQPWVNSGIGNMFSTAAYRLGHSMLSPQLLRLKKNGKPIKYGNLALRDAFFAPWLLADEKDIAPLLRGLATQQAQEIDPYVIDDVRNFLFGQPGSGGFDLASLNIQRGRDHGIPSYNAGRIAYGMSTVTNWTDITSDPEIQDRMSSVYSSVEDVDMWVGALAEDHHDGAMVGDLLYRVLKDQFERLRNGDRFYYKNVFSEERIAQLEKVTLAKIIRRNTKIDDEIPDNVFLCECE